jgi:soluble lytic murein transglycosylase-like protein
MLTSDLPVTRRALGEGLSNKQWSHFMVRIPHYLALGVFAAVSLAQSAQASDRHHRHYVAYRSAQAVQQNVAGSPYYGPFGDYADAAAGSRYAGPNARRYFNSVPDQRSQYAGLVEQHASANGVPASLVHRVIMRESRYNPRAVSAGNYGIMQIRLGTARAMGYTGSAAGLLDAQTNMTYAVRYLAGAYQAAHGNESLAVALYARGYNAPRVQEASFNTFTTPAPRSNAPARSFNAPASTYTSTSSGYGGTSAFAPGPASSAYVPPGADSPVAYRAKRLHRSHA